MSRVRNDRSGVAVWHSGATAAQLLQDSYLGSRCSGVAADSLSLAGIIARLNTRSAALLADHSARDGETCGCYEPLRTWRALLTEVVRGQAFERLQADLYLEAGRSASGTSTRDTECDVAVLTIRELEELRARWVISSISSSTAEVDFATGGERELLTAVDALDERMVHWSGDGDGTPGLYRVVSLSPLSEGEYWVDIAPCHQTGEAEVRRVDREAVRVVPSVPLFLDPLLPCDELTQAHGASKCLYLAFLTGCSRRLGASVGRRSAMTRSLAMAKCARNRRQELWGERIALQETLRSASFATLQDGAKHCGKGLVVSVKDSDCVTLRLYQLEPETQGKVLAEVEVLRREVEKLAMLWDTQATRVGGATARESISATQAVEVLVSDGGALPSTPGPGLQQSIPTHMFYYHLFQMLLRYQSFMGKQGYNQGPQAAIPPAIMGHLQQEFHTCVEAFASPLNVYASHTQFCSLFPDVDAPFGSCGSFFDVDITAGCFEVNPPFDATVLREMERHIEVALQRATLPLLFVVVLPSHDWDSDGNARAPEIRVGVKRRRETSVEHNLRESARCLGHVLCPADEAVYVDGHQHLLRVPLFRITTPTRLILLGNEAARNRLPDAKQKLERVRTAWKEWTASVCAGAEP